MSTPLIIVAVVLFIVAVFALSTLMVCVIRIQEQDAKIEDLRRELNNVQDGGKEITKRLNEYERSLSDKQS